MWVGGGGGKAKDVCVWGGGEVRPRMYDGGVESSYQ